MTNPDSSCSRLVVGGLSTERPGVETRCLAGWHVLPLAAPAAHVAPAPRAVLLVRSRIVLLSKSHKAQFLQAVTVTWRRTAMHIFSHGRPALVPTKFDPSAHYTVLLV